MTILCLDHRRAAIDSGCKLVDRILREGRGMIIIAHGGVALKVILDYARFSLVSGAYA